MRRRHAAEAQLDVALARAARWLARHGTAKLGTAAGRAAIDRCLDVLKFGAETRALLASLDGDAAPDERRIGFVGGDAVAVDHDPEDHGCDADLEHDHDAPSGRGRRRTR